METNNKQAELNNTNRKPNKKLAIMAIASIPLIMTLGNSMLIPLLPLMEKELDISKFQSSLIITVYSIVSIFLIPVAGFLSDKYGRKIVIIPSLILTGIGGIICGWAGWQLDSAFTWIIIGRIFQGIGASGAFPIVLPLVGDICKEEAEASASLGIIETSNTFGKVLSPILGSLIAGIIWFMPFFAIPVLSLLSLLLIVFFVKKPKGDNHELSFGRFTKNIKVIFKQHWRWLTAVFIIGAILMFVLFGLLFYLSSILEDKYHYDGVKKGFLLAIPLAALCAASFIAGKVIKDNLTRMKWITFFGIVLTGISIGATLFSEKFIYLIVVFLVCGIGIGAALPCLDSILTQSIEKEMRGTITSIFSSMRFLGVAAGPPVIALLMKGKILDMIILLGVLSVIGAWLSFKAIKPEEKKQATKVKPVLE
ncbi:MFS transporter [Lederbergia galactosidilytica]|uniref:MFS transporter n=1 Tax=Lederbergia galactosidilytica TaxID=217031 RepID=A0A177ZWL2_9BACI|nr:MFS transporter [Lederbergia galactosidilytica]KRG12422.1 MFS transporter [Virgibacillus soli]MBP1916608.1 ACDE family multidrug resistance protein [Lederbergia galactosidilytica]OAK72224.1 MFS transporter [Lederbergia galactosidilytica]